MAILRKRPIAFAAGVFVVGAVVPAGAGGGWDFTCRSVGKLLYEQELVASPVQVKNVLGGDRAVAFSQVIFKRNNDDNLLVAGSTVSVVIYRAMAR